MTTRPTPPAQDARHDDDYKTITNADGIRIVISISALRAVYDMVSAWCDEAEAAGILPPDEPDGE